MFGGADDKEWVNYLARRFQEKDGFYIYVNPSEKGGWKEELTEMLTFYGREMPTDSLAFAARDGEQQDSASSWLGAETPTDSPAFVATVGEQPEMIFRQ